MYNLYRWLSYIVPPIFLSLFFIYGNESVFFDRLYLGALLASCYFCYRDKDALGAIIIVVLFWLASELLFILPNTLPFKIAVYGFSLTVALVYRQLLIGLLLAIMTVFGLIAEVYWQMTDYPHTPEMLYYFGLLSTCVVAKRLLYYRIPISSQYFNYTSGKIALDFRINGIFDLYYILCILNIIEYYLRHVSEHRDIMLMYTVWQPANVLLSLLTLSFIYHFYFKYQAKKHFTA